MEPIIKYLNPAGNITAIVSGAPLSDRLRISKEIMDSNLAEQVGFEAAPLSCDKPSNLLGRLEMMGGEFCGNAARSFGFLKASALYGSGRHEVLIEISGANDMVKVISDIDNSESYAAMPKPLSIEPFEVQGDSYPLVRMEGIDHLVVTTKVASPEFAGAAIEAINNAFHSDACGVLFVESNGSELAMTPVVFVRDTNSTVWESSCGSGSVAASCYAHELNLEVAHFIVKQPGGEIKVNFEGDGTIMMGGPVEIM